MSTIIGHTSLDKNEYDAILALIKFFFLQVPMTFQIMVKSQTGA